uniref:Uncharacterized protein n=1 Tax=Plectus sambesii TaxID=2011161 RepID=A0A914X309_9BILA
MSSADELIGADVLEHGLTGHNIAGYDVEDTVKNTRAFGSAMQALSKWKAITRTSAIRRKEEEERIKQASSWLEHEQPIHESHKPSSARTSISAVVLGNASNCNGAQARRQQLRRSYTTDV